MFCFKANVRTHLMDASNIYGSLPNIAKTLRDKNGRLLINKLNILPQRVANVTAIDYDRYFTGLMVFFVLTLILAWRRNRGYISVHVHRQKKGT